MIRCQSFFHLAVGLSSLVLISSCAAKLKPLASEHITADPRPLELVGTEVPASFTINIPSKWMNKNAQVSFVPVLRYKGGETWGATYTIQGENVRDNNSVVPYEAGGTTHFSTRFTYTPRMQESDLYLSFRATIKGKQVTLPDVKVGEGVLSTVTLAGVSGCTPVIAPDAFQRVIKDRYDADILFLIQQANVRSSELKKQEVSELRELIENAHEAPNQRVSVEVQAYASPDGGLALNEKLSAQREKNTSEALHRALARDIQIAAHYTAEDWEGFRTFVEQSNIQDKDLILRVLSMYTDPEEREREIRNISLVFSQLAQDILPKLRRSRVSALVETIGKSDLEIAELAQTTPQKLTIEELLYAAAIAKTDKEKQQIYQKATGLYPKDARAYNNIAALLILQGKNSEAKTWLERGRSVNDTPEARLNLALLALEEGKTSEAEELIGQSLQSDNGEVLALLYLKQGKYEQALKAFSSTKSNNAAIAQLLNRRYDSAMETLNNVVRTNATTDYLKAIVAARMQDDRSAINFLSEAIRRDPALRSRAISDKEFASLANNERFVQLLK